MKSVLIIGMGIFGQTLAQTMSDMGHEVMIVDKSEEVIQELSETFPDSFIGDATHPSVVKDLGVNNYDICFVAIGEEYYSSLEITSLLKDHGAKYIISKAKRNRQVNILKKLGADEVVFPEKETAERLAMRSSSENIFDYFELDPTHAIYEIPIQPNWEGKSIAELNIRRTHNINIVAIKNAQGINPYPTPDYRFKSDDHIVVVGDSEHVVRLTEED